MKYNPKGNSCAHYRFYLMSTLIELINNFFMKISLRLFKLKKQG